MAVAMRLLLLSSIYPPFEPGLALGIALSSRMRQSDVWLPSLTYKRPCSICICTSGKSLGSQPPCHKEAQARLQNKEKSLKRKTLESGRPCWMFQAQVSSQMNAAVQISSAAPPGAEVQPSWAQSTHRIMRKIQHCCFNLLSFAVTETPCRQSVFVVLAVFSSRGM